ncbi:hypothetical protein BGZ65_005558 [Modicella reniformis]|uniref:Protein kinase domain-containing protein n=1 Tax=Modicella reniformis TaxID=1440133 RepID=A0A9P6LXN2_9FUNG|nr:hypothetical protein BGZ65_005558 [Modicella reniformis]
MTLSIPQPIPTRSSHSQAHQRPSIRRTQSHNTPSDSPTVNSSRFSLSQILANAGHLLHKTNIGEDELTLNNDDDDECCQAEEDEDDESCDENHAAKGLIDSGHYSSDLDDLAVKSRGIPIGKPGFLYHLYGTAEGPNVDSRSRLAQDLQDVSHYHPRYSHSNNDSHTSVNLIANNCKKTHSPTFKVTVSNGDNDNRSFDDDIQSMSSSSHLQPSQVQQQQQKLHQEVSSDPYSNGRPSPSSSLSCSPSAPTAFSSSLSFPSLTPASSTASQRAHKKEDAPVTSQHTSFQSGFQGSHQSSSHVDKASTCTTASTDTKSFHPHLHPNISIDTSKVRLLKVEEEEVLKDGESQPSVNEPTRPKRAPSVSAISKTLSEGQLSIGLKREDKTNASTTTTTSSAAASSSSTIPVSSNSSTRPLMMASQSRLSSALPPVSIPSFHQQQLGTNVQQEFPSLSPSSPRASPALVNSLEQLSVSWKSPEHTPSFPTNRLNRSRTISSGARPVFTNSSFSSNGGYFSSNTSSQYQSSSVMSPSMVTSSSYSSLPYSPAVAFLSNFVDVTAPRMAPDEEGEQVGDFIMGKIIGHGGFSLVREAFAVHMDGLVARVAVKIVKTQTGATDNDRVQRMLDKEIAIWSRLSHPNVLPFLAVEKFPTDTFVFCELCSGGHLLDYLTRQVANNSSSPLSPRSGGSTVGLEESQARVIFNQVAEAVRYLHEEKRIVHRDIKLENILQHEDGTWKICDFGLAEYQNDEAASYFGAPLSPTIYSSRRRDSATTTASTASSTDQDGCSSAGTEEEEDDMVGGSLAYCSPEQLRSQKPLRCPSSDVWSLGVVLYALLTGRLPFQDEYEPRLQFQILNGRYEDPTECSPEARDLLKNMFQSKPDDRWRIGQVIDSPWCMGTTLESLSSSSMSFGFGGFGDSTARSGGDGSESGGMGFSNHNNGSGGDVYSNSSNSDHTKMNNFFATFRF